MDSFGLPAENAAIKHGIHPSQWTLENIAFMRDKQLKRMGLSYDWTGSDHLPGGLLPLEPVVLPEDVREGIAYKKRSYVNWCPSCNTVLATSSGGGRLLALRLCRDVRELEQWFFRITAYAEELLASTDKLPLARTVLRCSGTGSASPPALRWTSSWTAPVRNLRSSPPGRHAFRRHLHEHRAEHPWWKRSSRETAGRCGSGLLPAIMAEDKAARTDENQEKEGIFTGAYAVNPLNNEKVAVWIGNLCS